MSSNLKITFKNIESTEQVKDHLEAKYDRIRRVHGNIIRCNVTVAQPHRRHKNGNEYLVSVRMVVPGMDIVGRSRENTDLFTCIGEAFGGVEKQLKSIRSRKGAVANSRSTTASFSDAASIRSLLSLSGASA